MQRNSIGVGIAFGIVLLVAGTGAVTALGGPTPVATQTDTGNATVTDGIERTIRVTATGDAEADPDQAVVRVTVRAEGDDVGTVRDELAAESADLTAAFDDLGLKYETTGYGISERYQRKERPTIPTSPGPSPTPRPRRAQKSTASR